MKRIMSIFLILSVCLGLCACRPDTNIEQPVNFYYRNAEVTFGTENGVISAFIAESAGYDGTLELLNAYLKGPDDESLHATFPPNTEVLDLHILGSHAQLRMNDALARYSGIDLTVACACLTMTTIELTGVDTVTIAAASQPLDGAAAITMDLEDLMLMDIYTPETTEQ